MENAAQRLHCFYHVIIVLVKSDANGKKRNVNHILHRVIWIRTFSQQSWFHPMIQQCEELPLAATTWSNYFLYFFPFFFRTLLQFIEVCSIYLFPAPLKSLHGISIGLRSGLDWTIATPCSFSFSTILLQICWLNFHQALVFRTDYLKIWL